jgi:hypothetical protein
MTKAADRHNYHGLSDSLFDDTGFDRALSFFGGSPFRTIGDRLSGLQEALKGQVFDQGHHDQDDHGHDQGDHGHEPPPPPPPPQGSIDFSVTIVDPAHFVDDLDSAIIASIKAAGAEWASHLAPPSDGANVTIDLEVDMTIYTPRAATPNGLGVQIETSDGITIDQTNVAYKILTGEDPNGVLPDNTIVLNPDYVRNELYFSPDPTNPNSIIPSDKTDAESVFAHEIGHELAFSGLRDFSNPTTFTTPGFETVFDSFVTVDSSDHSFFTGPNAEAAYGGQPVPLTLDNIYHVGNQSAPGDDLINDLMNGVVYFRGTHYDISDLDLAILKDCGLDVVDPSASAIVAANMPQAGIQPAANAAGIHDEAQMPVIGQPDHPQSHDGFA